MGETDPADAYQSPDSLCNILYNQNMSLRNNIKEQALDNSRIIRPAD